MEGEGAGGLVGVDGAGRGCRLEDRGRRTVMGCQCCFNQGHSAARASDCRSRTCSVATSKTQRSNSLKLLL